MPGGKLKIKGDQSGDEGVEVELPPITGQLAEWGTLTKTLAETFSRVASRSEDLRRYQSVILSSLGISEVSWCQPWSAQECYSHSDRAEYFLDLSLPVAAFRPQPPAIVRRKTNEENNTNTQEEKPSKHQLKKERYANRRVARKSHKESDADVEDNLEDQPRQTDTSTSVGTQAVAHTAANFAAYHMESGYNSRKSSAQTRSAPVLWIWIRKNRQHTGDDGQR
ncbi:unnamed protein product [Danaus chrysippus]|uniref:(African queen) hypothetical protein n=1 Tax=Danaus chrysippus TaxID=151541 RepID=A0A8J2QKR0_9NEOP|nr:unnamed protein product [Danaus chrysippus]